MYLGLVTILFGALSLLAVIGGAVSLLFTQSMFESSIQNEVFAAQRKYMPWTISQHALGAILAICLLIGGIALVRRRSGSRKLLLTWAALKIPIVVVSTVLGFIVQREMFAIMMKNQQSGGPNAAMAAPMMETFALVGVIIGLAWGSLLPVFLLIWLNRASIRREMAAWR